MDRHPENRGGNPERMTSERKTARGPEADGAERHAGKASEHVPETRGAERHGENPAERGPGTRAAERHAGQGGRTDGTPAGKKVSLNGTGDPDLDPFEINFLPEFRVGRGPRGPFVNEHGVVIGDHEYASPNSPLERWSKDTDPAVMSGDEWVHPFKDIGFRTSENRMLFEEGVPPQAGIFMHPDKDAAYQAFRTDDPAGGRPEMESEKERPD